MITITITVSGDVGSGKSRATETIIRALSRSKTVKVMKKQMIEGYRSEIAILNCSVKEPHKSKR